MRVGSTPAPATACALAAAVRGGRRSARAECERRLELAAARADLGAVWTLDARTARQQARAVDRAVAAGRDPGALAGVPVGWKDCFDVAGLPSGAGRPPETVAPARLDAVAVARLRDAGAVSIGKLAMDQLAWSMTGQCPGHAACRNPHDRARSPGGSSSGSAVAVAAGLVDLAPGTDAGGSVRVPAALCGVVGVMAGHGAVALDGCLPYCPTLDQAGPIARTVDDCAAALAALGAMAAGAVRPPPIAALRLGVLERWFCASLPPGVEAAFRAALDALARAGARLREVDLGWQDDPDVLRAIYDAEPLPRFAGLVRGHPDAFRPEIRADVERGMEVRAVAYLDALERLRQRRRRAGEALGGCDVVVSPTVPIEAPALDGPDRTRELNRNTRPFNGLRWPALSLPCGRDGGGRPVGLQLAAGPGRLGELLGVALAVEAALGYGAE